MGYKVPFELSYTRHHNPLLIINRGFWTFHAYVLKQSVVRQAILITSECVSTGAAGAQTCRSLRYYPLHPRNVTDYTCRSKFLKHVLNQGQQWRQVKKKSGAQTSKFFNCPPNSHSRKPDCFFYNSSTFFDTQRLLVADTKKCSSVARAIFIPYVL